MYEKYKYLYCYYTFDFRWLLSPEHGGKYHVKIPTPPGTILIFGGRRANRHNPVYRDTMGEACVVLKGLESARLEVSTAAIW